MSEGQRERAKRALADAYEASWTQVQVLAQAYPGRKPIYLEPQDFAEGAVDAVLSAIFPVRGADDGLVERVAEAMVKADDNYINTYGESGETAFSPNFRLLARAAVAAVRAAGTEGQERIEELEREVVAWKKAADDWKGAAQGWEDTARKTKAGIERLGAVDGQENPE